MEAAVNHLAATAISSFMRPYLYPIVLLAGLAVALAGCAANRAATPGGWVDHNNDGYLTGGM